VIISHRHRYVFVELPRTGSTAVRHELRELYDGEAILRKHATYEEFRRQASPAELEYFSFSAIRNPLDDVISRYHKLLTDHKERFTDPRVRARQRPLNRLIDDRMYRFLRRPDADFPTFFMHFYVLPYDTWASLSHDRLDYVMRFERLSEDFAAVLGRIGIEPVRPLPVVNATSRPRGIAELYPPETRGRARRVFGPYMQRWGYRFPDEWHVGRPSTGEVAQYRLFSLLAGLYWRHLRPVMSRD
jgi:hypothetical protein